MVNVTDECASERILMRLCSGLVVMDHFMYHKCFTLDIVVL